MGSLLMVNLVMGNGGSESDDGEFGDGGQALRQSSQGVSC